MSKNLHLGQYKSLNALPKVFELGDQNRYMFFLSSFKPFCLDKYYPKLVQDYEERKLDNKSLYWIVTELNTGTEKPAVKWVQDVTGKMKTRIDKNDIEGFWELFPELKQHVELFLMDYYKLFPDKKPAQTDEQKAPEPVKMELKPPPKKKNFFMGLDEEDDVIMEIKRQKSSKNQKVVVDARKLAKEVAQEENKKNDFDDKLKKFEQAMAKKDEVKDINENAIFENVMNLAKATDEVGQNPLHSPDIVKKKLGHEAPARMNDVKINISSIDDKKSLFKKKSFSTDPKLAGFKPPNQTSQNDVTDNSQTSQQVSAKEESYTQNTNGFRSPEVPVSSRIGDNRPNNRKAETPKPRMMLMNKK